MARHFF